MARLIYIMGPSGCGKDSLMNAARTLLPAEAPVLFAHRYITRRADTGGENHVALSRTEFQMRLNKGLFALSWESHGFSYGLGREIDLWLEKGMSVVMNGSRQALPAALRTYPDLRAILVTVPEEILRQRLAGRGRENAQELERRFVRARMDVAEAPGMVRFDNSGSLAERGRALANLILETTFTSK